MANIVKIPDGRKFKIACVITVMVNGEIVTKVKRFKYDTGAQLTCIPAKDINIDETSFKKTFAGNSVTCIGIDGTSKIVYYPFQTENFTVAGIGLGSIPIYITFDSRAQKRLLGLDIIRLLNAEFNFDTKEAKFSITKQLSEFHTKKLRLEISDMFEMGIYSANDCKNDIDSQSTIFN